jgi:hypothetical protein
MRKLRVFGITAIEINGLTVHTCNVRVNYTPENKHICETFCSLQPAIVYTIAGKGVNRYEKAMLAFQFTTADTEKFRLYTQEVGKVLKHIAEDKINLKYQWIQPQVADLTL